MIQMANVKEITIPNISIHFSYLEDALSAVLHTILFVRAPNIGMPRVSGSNLSLYNLL